MNTRPTGCITRWGRTGRRTIVRAGGFVLLALVAGPGVEAVRAQDRRPDHPAPPTSAAADTAAGSEIDRLVAAKRYEPAITRLRERLARHADDRDARVLLARVLSWDRRYDESLAEYERLLADRPADATLRARYAVVLVWSGRPERSLGEFRRALATDSANVEARVAYARVLSWTGDLPGAAMEFRRVLDAHPTYADAWIGYATIARWRAGATASDRFLTRAEALGAAAAEERTAVRNAFAPSVGGGWTSMRERQYLDGPDFTLATRGPFMSTRMTVGRTADVTLRAAWLDLFQRDESGALAYDANVRQIRADVGFMRAYPFQIAGGFESRSLASGVPGVAYPLLGSGDFVGWNAHAWWFLGRFTPSAAAWREFVPIKSTSGPAELLVGHQTVSEAKLAWQWGGRGRIEAAVERGDYSDGNTRRAVRAGTEYRVRTRAPIAALDYAVARGDYDATSASYFTPLNSLRQAAGFGISGYGERSAISYGARYEFSNLSSDNFDAIRTNLMSFYVSGARLGPIRFGLDGTYSHDNNAYEIWTLGLHMAAHW